MEYKNFNEYIKSMLTDTQCKVLRIQLSNVQPVAFYGKGLGKSMLALILQQAGYQAFAPEDVKTDCGPLTVPDVKGAVAFCVKNKDEFAAVVTANSFTKLEIREWVTQTH